MVVITHNITQNGVWDGGVAVGIQPSALALWSH